MSKELEAGCPCVERSCPRHGDCVACETHHKKYSVASACRRPGVTMSAEHRERVQARLQAAGLI